MTVDRSTGASDADALEQERAIADDVTTAPVVAPDVTEADALEQQRSAVEDAPTEPPTIAPEAAEADALEQQRADADVDDRRTG